MIRMWAALAVLWSCFALGILSTRFSLLRLRTLLAGLVLLGATVVVRALRRGWRPRPVSAEVAALATVHVLVIAISALYYEPTDRTYGMASLALLTGIGWLIWIETRARPVTGETTAVPDGTARVIFVGCMTVSLALLAGFWLADRAPLVSSTEELLYLIQASAVRGEGLAYAVDPEVVGAFRLPWIRYGADSLVPQSAAGWPVLLSAAQKLGMDEGVGLVLTLGNVALTAVIGRRLFGVRGSLLAAAFVAFNPIVARFGPTYLPHAVTLFLILCGLLILLGSVERQPDDARRLMGELGAGVLLGLAVLTRPLSALALATAVVFWLHARLPVERRYTLSRTVPRLLLGALPPLAVVLLADSFSLGWPFRWSHGDPFAGALPSGETSVLAMNLAEALKATWFSFGALGAFALVGVLLLAGVRPRARAVAPFLLLPALTVFVAGGSVRAYHEAVPFMAFGFAWSVLELRRRDASLARAACVFVLAGALATSALLLYSMGRLDRVPGQLYAAVESAHARWGRLLVIVPVGTPESVIGRLWHYNIGGLDGDVVVALETNPVTNRDVIERHADRQVMVLRRGPDGGWQLQPLRQFVGPGRPLAY